MVLGSEVDSPAVRFGLYIDELREFFAGRGMQFGSPEDIFRLADRLSTASFFRDELSSMVRAIIYREFEGISRDELLEVLAVAIGGPQIDLLRAEFRSSAGEIRRFLGEVLHSLWKAFPGEVSAAEPTAESEAVVAEPHPTEIAAAPVQELTRPELATGSMCAAGSAAVLALEVEADRSGSNQDVISRARAALDRAAHPDTVVAPPRAEVSEPSAHPEFLAHTPLWRRFGGPSFWIVGMCGLLVGLIGGLMLRYRPPVLSAPALGIVESHHTPLPLAAKPSPYELPIRDTRVASEPASPGLAATAQRPRGRATSHSVPAAVSARRAASAVQLPASRSEVLGFRAVPQPVPTPAETFGGPETAEVTQAAEPDPRHEAYSGLHAPVYMAPRPSVFLSSSGVMTSNLLFAPAPQYPVQAISAGVQGRVVLQALVWRDGTVAATHVLGGDSVLGAAAEAAVRHWRYRPYIADGRASDVATVIMVEFRLPR